jgi:mono/diheme cytochrome c family protein
VNYKLTRTTGRRTKIGLAGITLALVGAAGCHTDMWVQPKPKPQSESDFFVDGQNNRPPIPHVVDRAHLRTDDAYWKGIKGVNVIDGKPAGAVLMDEIPAQVYDAPEYKTASGDKKEALSKILDRGHERFNIFCSPCHGELGDGNGMIAKRGFSVKVPPRNYHTDRLRAMPIGHFFDVITNGYGAMTPRAFQVDQNDRWAIAAYIRVLQYSQHAEESDLKSDEIGKIDRPAASAEGNEKHGEGERK